MERSGGLFGHSFWGLVLLGKERYNTISRGGKEGQLPRYIREWMRIGTTEINMNSSDSTDVDMGCGGIKLSELGRIALFR